MGAIATRSIDHFRFFAIAKPASLYHAGDVLVSNNAIEIVNYCL